MKSETQSSLLQRLRDGNAAMAWDEFFQRYWRLIFVAASRRGCSDHTAEEIVQDVMLTVFQQRDTFRYDPARGRFRDWLGKVVSNAVAQHRRRPAQRIRARGGDDTQDFTELRADDLATDAAWEAAYEEGMLAVLLDVVRREVAPETFQAFELLTLHEFSGTRVAGITGLSRNAVYLARKRVLKRLHELGASYREKGTLDHRLRQALESFPTAEIERSVATRVEETIRSNARDSR